MHYLKVLRKAMFTLYPWEETKIHTYCPVFAHLIIFFFKQIINDFSELYLQDFYSAIEKRASNTAKVSNINEMYSLTEFDLLERYLS